MHMSYKILTKFPMPAHKSADITGKLVNRFDDGTEMLKIKDRHYEELYGPINRR